MKTVCFTGRRPKDLCGYDWQNYSTFQNDLVTFLDTLYQNGTRRFISGGAQGFDQMAFWAVHKLKSMHPDIENIVYVPFEGQQNKWLDGNTAFSKAEYAKMLQVADITNVLVPKDKIIQSRYTSYLFSRNHHMVDDSDFVVALYPNDEWHASKGGTAETMRYANSKMKPIMQIIYKIENNRLIFDTVKHI